MKKTLLLLLLTALCTLEGHTQTLGELVQILTENTQPSISIHHNSVYYTYFKYDKNGFTVTTSADSDGNTYTLENGQTSMTIKWTDLDRIGITNHNRIALTTDPNSDKGYFITPKNGVDAESIIMVIEEIYYKITDEELEVITVLSEPLDDEKTVIDSKLHSLHMEFTVRSSGILIGTPSDGTETAPYDIDEVRLNLSLGKKHLRFDIGIVGYSWVDLPGFNKYNSSGTLIGSDKFQTGSFYTPSLGLSYVFYPQPALMDDYVYIEFPVSVSAAPMLFGSSTDFDANTAEGDTPYEDYFGFSYFANASAGVTLYLGKEFGISIRGGIFYMGVTETTETVSRLNNAGVAEEFTYKFDENESRIKPHIEFSLVFRI
jgi:hypothetical protein